MSMSADRSSHCISVRRNSKFTGVLHTYIYLFRCPDGGHCVHYENAKGSCCYKIVCEDDAPSGIASESASGSQNGTSADGSWFTVPAEKPSDCNRTLCPVMPAVCDKEGTCLVKSICEEGGLNCSCKVEIRSVYINCFMFFVHLLLRQMFRQQDSRVRNRV